MAITVWEQDIRRIASVGAAEYLQQIEESELTEGFWDVALPGALETTSTASPFFQSFLAAQVASHSRGFLARSITVAAMHQQSGDIHQIVPKAYLQENGFADRGDYNQVGNFAPTETSINISISKRPPAEYMADVTGQIDSGSLALGEIVDHEDLAANFAENAIPANIGSVTVADYPDFLRARRQLMASIIRKHFEQL